MKQQNQYMKDVLNRLAYEEIKNSLGYNTLANEILSNSNIDIWGY